ncbi:UDP-4-amino-4-deoxy-L-arabinose formyltransferase/UDP-glucuronic acid dehydrogenase (UDP-4-keto-hexauronic acid decarboxylating) [Rubricella aquisinus]|uniref:UDP-4-amino-4-deoxy-L-arabinose formyltransferase/UDP-glucuronic acid dehydrogenase (UDP-4-keto-hexauronic acid decarboxylating) n=1 Tax=Rubricella aquisinus TaxID=2028108 RepID=A0A840WHE8_9RHOB|nr:formyltransferase family protein [Rubricella aquisinus]MBB5514548.1 UDP-4-amino-4-deoxy-L-arabinose formyltransferase/UDP-glucuronic acid dehydrogenase (UDP-4-keto-hexauronic acid decarboxylating) [Rubricella aquisinus]
MTTHRPLRILILCTVSTGLDAVQAVLSQTNDVVGLVGLHPDQADPTAISGYVDIRSFCTKNDLPAYLVQSYTLSQQGDRLLFDKLDFDLIWVAGWQRLIPKWLIEMAPLGALGSHGSPDGIQGGRGRSPQNWALILGCRQFSIALFRITPGVDEGDVIAEQSFFYEEQDDIVVSYYRASIATADMVCEVLNNPAMFDTARPQNGMARYLPQRRPQDGWVDWNLPARTIARHARALTRPYPGLQTSIGDMDLRLWRCQVFDDVVSAEPGAIQTVFLTGEFLVSCGDGRLLVRDWTASNSRWLPKVGNILKGKSFDETMAGIIDGHQSRYDDQLLSRRLAPWMRKHQGHTI